MWARVGKLAARAAKDKVGDATMSDEIRTKRAMLSCWNCDKVTLHYFSHDMLVEERKRGVLGTYIERVRDLWYKCQSCMSFRRWGQEHVSPKDARSTTRTGP
jgi:hypothetical protein